MEGHFEIQLLGPPQLRWRDRSFNLPRRQARALLYRLAAHSSPSLGRTGRFTVVGDPAGHGTAQPDAAARLPARASSLILI